MFNPRFFAGAAALPLLAIGTHANAQERADLPSASQGAADHSDWKPFFVKVGPAHVGFDESAKVTVEDAIVPGGSANTSNNWGVAGELGYYFNPNVSVALMLGVPPTTKVSGAGSLASAGALGDVTYGPAVASIRYHLTDFGAVRPYVGAGVNYTMILKAKDRLLQDFKVDDAVGVALVGGVDIALTKRWGLYADVKKVWVQTNATFKLPVADSITAPGEARIVLNPLIVNAGISYRF